MKIFNGRLATEDYMSTHSLTFSTPEMTLKKFALWLGESVKNSTTNSSTPRLLIYLEDKPDSKTNSSTPPSDYLPDVDESFKPTGAIADFYSTKDTSTENISSGSVEKKYCINCGNTIKHSSKFCNKCGSVVE
ncbi:MAG TPA: zinc ribbon domain-containing protein [Candidatus Nitrosocosmicus sp.]|nr:zinc ribbon domain-containing protein [Candidatus Nitrosocosmicus sp.]